MRRFRNYRLPASLLMTALMASVIPAMNAQERYKLPPKEVIDILDAPPAPRAMVSSSGSLLMLIESEPMPSIAYLAKPVLKLAGMRIMPSANSRQVLGFYNKLSFKQARAGSRSVDAALPEGSRFTSVTLSPDEAQAAFLRHLDDGVELWVADTLTGRARALTTASVNALFFEFEWLPDSRRIIVSLVPEDRGRAPKASDVPQGPDVQETSGKFAKAATFQDLLKTAHDAALFEYYATSRMAIVDTAEGTIAPIGRPGIYAEAAFSPDMNFVLVGRIKRPFSYLVPYYSFARSFEIWDPAGTPVHILADLPPAEDVPLNGVTLGPRDQRWMAGKPSTLAWVEAIDGGDPENAAPFRDRWMTMAAPFSGEPREVLKLSQRSDGLAFLMEPGLALAYEYDWKTERRTIWQTDFDRPENAPRKIFDLNAKDRYNDPGIPVFTILPKTGERVVLQDGNWVYLQGEGASPKGDYPFLDKMNLKTLVKERIFQCQDPAYESFVAFAGPTGKKLITRRETVTEPPNYQVLDLKSRKRIALTDIKDPAPQLTGVKKERIRYKRSDGIELSGTLYLPPDYKRGERRPVVIWAYPIEYSDASTAGQVRGSLNRFTYYRGSSHLFFVTQGYVVLDNAEMPVIGDPKTVNDTFVKQIVDNAAAAIGKLNELGVGDPKRVGVGGHSYGAFMTANLLAHCDLFAAGIARSGAYNRTLTPFGFQSERRTLWEAPDTYIHMSPFMHADKIKEPILLIHGESDNNTGTFPIQSERLYAALRGFGGTARLVLLPCESHGYAARESVLDVLAEMFEWFDKYVKNRKAD